MPYKGGVQLLPETRQQAMRRAVAGSRLVYWGLSLGIFVLVVNIVLSAYAASLKQQIADANGQLRTQENARDREAEKQLQAVQRQSRLMSALLGGHVYWSRAFDLIEDLMQSSVRLKTLSASSGDGVVQFNAVGISYAAVAQQLASFASGPGVLDVSFSGAQAVPGGVEFTGEVRLDGSAVLRSQQQELPQGAQ